MHRIIVSDDSSAIVGPHGETHAVRWPNPQSVTHMHNMCVCLRACVCMDVSCCCVSEAVADVVVVVVVVLPRVIFASFLSLSSVTVITVLLLLAVRTQIDVYVAMAMHSTTGRLKGMNQ